jgi:hypothetical protein
MKSKARQVSARLLKAMTRRALLAMLIAGFLAVLAGVGAWTHTVYAAKVRAEEVARKQAATLEQVMAKLNQMQSQMQAQSDVMNAKLETLRYANAKLASYLLRTNARQARIEHAVAYVPASSMGGGGGGNLFNKSPVQLQAQLCGQAAVNGELKYKPEIGVKGYGRGNVGLDEFGDGVEADVRVQEDKKLEAGIGGQAQLSFQVCYQFNPTINFPTGVDTTALSNTVDTATQQVASKISTFISNHPQLAGSNLSNVIDNLDNFKANLTPQDVLNSIQDPKQTLNEVSGLLQNLPLPSDIQTFIADPSAVFPTASDLTPEALCGTTAAASGFLYFTCNNVPPVVGTLNNVSSVVNKLTNFTTNLTDLETGLSNVEAGVTTTCGFLNDKVTTLDNTSVSIGPKTLTSFVLPTGVSPTYVDVFGYNVMDGVSLNTKIQSIDLPTLSVNPFSLSTVQCPSF